MTRVLYPALPVLLMLLLMAAAVSCGASMTMTPGGGLTVKPTGPGATSGPDYNPPLSGEVIIQNYAYVPAALTVKTGTKVTWTNKDTVKHTVTTDKPFFDSGLFGKDQSYSFTFNDNGTYEYYCIPHPYMTGKVIVE
jgi:amicyanin